MIDNVGYLAIALWVISAWGGSALSSVTHAAEGAPAVTIEVDYDGGLLAGVVRDAPLADVLRTIAMQANFSLVIRGNLTLAVTYSFENTPLDEAVRLLLGDTSQLMVYQPAPDRAQAQVPVMLVVYATSDPTPGVGTSSPALSGDMRSKLEHPNVVVRVDAVRELATEKLAGDFELLVDVLRSEEDPGLRQVAAAALTRFPDKPGAAALMAVLTDGDSSPVVRKQAAWSLGALHDEKAPRLSAWTARRALEQAARSDPDKTVRRAASAVLAKW